MVRHEGGRRPAGFHLPQAGRRILLRVSEIYSGEPGAIAAARRTTAAFFARIGGDDAAAGPVPPEVVGSAQLVVSELATNAVKHGGGRFGLDLELVDDAVEITVWDTSADGVKAAEPDPTRVGQHGLEIVSLLCGGFTVHPTPDGKAVRARMALPA